MKLTAITLFLLTTTSVAHAQSAASCAEFNNLVKKTYNFDPSKLTPTQMEVKSKLLDKFWATVKARKREFLPCLRVGVESQKSNGFFRFDGSNLLIYVDPSMTSKALQTRVYTTTHLDLDVINRQRWLVTLTQRANEGFDITEGAMRWINDPKSSYTYGDTEGEDTHINNFMGALFLFGSMNEAQATPALVKIVKDVKHPQRMAALSILMDQGTPEALKTIKEIDPSTLSAQFKPRVQSYLDNPIQFVPREKPLTSRDEFVRAFNALLEGKSASFMALVNKVPDGERDVVAVMKPEDLPLLRKVRRKFISSANPSTTDYYDSFTGIILTMVRRGEVPAVATHTS